MNNQVILPPTEQEYTESNQTLFGLEEPIHENQLKIRWQQFLEKKKNRLTIALLGISGILLILVVFGSIAAALLQKPKIQVVTKPKENIKEITNPYQKRVVELRDQLISADPSAQEYPFPPINFSLRLDTRQGR